MTRKGRRLFFSRMVAILMIFLVAFPVSMSFTSISPARASDWAGWDAINTIYYNPAQEDADNPYLQTAAEELETYLEQMSGRAWTIVTNSSPSPPAVYLAVNSGMFGAYSDEAFRLVVDGNGVTITGKTALAVRHGAYYLLDEKLGVRWFFKSDIFTVVPTSLIDLNALNEIQEPDYIFRSLVTKGYEGATDIKNWNKRNRVYGIATYAVGHSSEDMFLAATGYNLMTDQEKLAYANANADKFLPTDRYPYTIDPWNMPNTYPWQLNPDNEVVIGWAKDYADTILSSGAWPQLWCWGDAVPTNLVSISPNDGGGWNPPWSDSLDIANGVYGLSNEVADYISETYPGRLVGTYSYALYSGIPSIALEPNILVMVATHYNYSDLTFVDRIQALKAKGIQVGIRDYTDIWMWNDDYYYVDRQYTDRTGLYYYLGARYFNGECADDWGGGGGLTYYMLSKLLWDSDLVPDDILDDFYTKSFGPASATMKEYYEIRSPTSENLAESFRLLDQAETEAVGNEAVLARIRYLEYYNRFMWMKHNVGIDNLSLSDLEDFYTFITKIRDLYVVTYSVQEDAARTELIDRGLTEGQVDALQDFTLPTTGEAATWMTEALDEWESTPDPEPSETKNPWDMELVALGDNLTAKLSPKYGLRQGIVVPSSGNETITARFKGDQGTIQWYDPTGLVLDTYEVDNLTDWTNVNFQTYLPGTYFLYGKGHNNGTDCYMDVQGRPASFLCTPGETVFNVDDAYGSNVGSYNSQTCTEYFYVPTGTDNFTYTAMQTGEGHTVSANLTDPNDISYIHVFTSSENVVISSPTAGLWKMTLTSSSPYYDSYFSFVGIPPLVWHDPEYLAVEAAGPEAPPVLNAIGDKTAHADIPLQFTVSATDPNGDDLTYSALNLPSWASFNATTRTFSGTPDQSGSYSNVHFEVSDGTFVDSEDITITVTANQAPVLTSPGDRSVNEGVPFSFTLSATDPDGDTLTYSSPNLPPGANLNPTSGVFSWTPAYDQAGIYSNIQFTVSDSQFTDSENIVIIVNNTNRAPVLNSIGGKTVTEGQDLQFTISATDPDGDLLTYSASNLPIGSSFNGTDRVFAWTPNSTRVGSYSGIHFEVTDSALTDFENIAITVSAASSDSPSGGGGGGGGDEGGSTSLFNSMTDEGKIVDEVIAASVDQEVRLVIPVNTVVKNSIGGNVNTIRITQSTEPTSPGVDASSISLYYDIQPGGTIFTPWATLVFKYEASSLPKDVAENNLYIALWNPVTMAWTDLEGTVDLVANTVSIPIEHLSTYALMAHARPANIEVAGLSLAPKEVGPGQDVTASIVVSNKGDLSGTYPVELKLDGVILQTLSINLAGGTSETVTFTVTSDTTGIHQVSMGGMQGTFLVQAPKAPAAFTASEFKINPTSISSGESVNISVLISNTGDLSGSYQAILEIDGVAAQTKEITLDGGASETISFDVNPDTSGLHSVNIGGLPGAFEVKSPPPLAITEQPELELSNFSATPNYDKTTNTLVDVRIVYQMNQTYGDFPGIQLVLKVFRNGELLEQVPLLVLSQLQEDGKTGELSYVPSSGWGTGEYSFQAELYDGENLVQDTLLQNLVVTPEAITKVFSWWTLGAVIGIATVLIVVLIAVIIYRRRDMLEY